jgi:histidinol phosphatase-like PHP family hydrolase
MKRVCADTNKAYKDIICLPGVEITHAAPSLVAALVKKARKSGSKVTVFHGETVVEPVEPGSNLAAIKAGVDILAHPGRITDEEAALAAKYGVLLEITARHGHNTTNRHVADAARRTGAKLCFNTDTHSPNNLVNDAERLRILKDAGLKDSEAAAAIMNSEEFVKRARKNKK